MNKILYSNRGVLLAAIVGVSTYCAQEIEVPAPVVPEPARERIALLDGTPIFRTDLDEYLSLVREGLEEGAGDTDTAKEFQEFLVQMLLWQKAVEQGISVEVNEKLGLRSPPSPEESTAARKWEGIFFTIQEHLRSQLDVAAQIRLSDLFKYYAQHQNEFEVGDRRRVLEIVVPTRSQAEVLRNQLEHGDFRKFRSLAVKHSVGQHDKGELGVVEKGQLPPKFEELIFSLSTGEISTILPSPFGYHIFCVEEQTLRHFQKFYEVQELIFDRLLVEKERQALHQLVEQRIAQADIQILDPELQSYWRKRDVDLGE